MDFVRIVTVLLIITQTVLCKKDTSMTTTTTAKITKFLDDMTDFLTDVLFSISTFIGLGETEEKSPSSYYDNDIDSSDSTASSSTWSMQNLMKYTMSTFKSGYKMVQDSIPVLQMARESVESVALVMPVNVTLATIVEHVLLNVTPELMKVDEDT